MFIHLFTITKNMTTLDMKYTLDDFIKITFDGFSFEFPPDVLKIISDLSSEVGSPNYVKTPIFTKKETINMDDMFYRKKKINKPLKDSEWEKCIANTSTIKSNESPTFENQLSVIRSHLNKLTDKNYKDIKPKIIQSVDEIFLSKCSEEELLILGNTMFDIASTNRFYSKIYAKLYADLIQAYQIMNDIFKTNFNNFMSLFENIEYVCMEIDYDKFCKNNKNNEKRKAIATFFMNLMENNVIQEKAIVQLVRNLMALVFTNISLENKKNEVDEWTENIAILYNKDIIENNANSYELINGFKITELIFTFSKSKPKTYPSLSSRSIFKYLDLYENI